MFNKNLKFPYVNTKLFSLLPPEVLLILLRPLAYSVRKKPRVNFKTRQILEIPFKKSRSFMTHMSTSYASTSRRGKRYHPGRSMSSSALDPFRGPVKYIKRTTGGKLRSGKASEELKYYDLAEAFTLTTTLASATTSPKTLNSVPQGTTQSQRIGNRIRVKSVMCQGYFKATGADGAAGNHDEFDNVARFMVLVDHQSNKALPAAGDILALSTSINSFRELDQSHRFTILYDYKVAINTPTHFEGTDGITAGVDSKYVFSFYKSGLDLLCQYDAATESVVSQINNSIIAMTFAEDALCEVVVFFNTRIRYTG